jgi:protein-L-isoaspartate O-methyltransferase
VVIQEFTQQAQTYAASPLIANSDRLAALVQAVRPHPGARVLDVAPGPGYVATAFLSVFFVVRIIFQTDSDQKGSLRTLSPPWFVH